MVEIRARQRTFHGAYSRTAIGNLGYALTIIRLFDKRFTHVGFIFAGLAVLLFALAFIRARHSRHDFADQPKGAAGKEDPAYKHPIVTVGQSQDRIFGRPFVTAGWIVIAVTVVVFAAEISLMVMVLQLDASPGKT